MRHKLGITVLAAVMALAGLREASEQFGTLKSSVSDWTRTSALGNLLVFAADGAEEAGAPQQPTVILAQTYLACRGAKSHPAASRPASTTRQAADERAKVIEGSSRAHSADELAMRFAAERDLSTQSAQTREQIVVKVMPQIAELAKELGAMSDGDAAGSVRIRESVEARVAHARAATELKKLGVKRIFVRVARSSDADGGKHVFTLRLPESSTTMPGVWSVASVGGVPVPTPTVAPELTAPAMPVEAFDFHTFFDAPPASHTSFDCDPDPLG
ncbi:MAG: hypothetical protein ACJ741_05895 [Pyrinomonadaceae bacterium]